MSENKIRPMLRNGMKVQFVEDCVPDPSTGEVHGANEEKFSVRYDDGKSVEYRWDQQFWFTILSVPKLMSCDRESVAMVLLTRRLTRNLVEQQLDLHQTGVLLDAHSLLKARYASPSEEKLSEFARGWMAAADKLAKVAVGDQT